MNNSLDDRNGFPDTFKTMEHIVAHIAKAGPGVDIDINNILMRFAMDVTGTLCSMECSSLYYDQAFPCLFHGILA